MDFLDTADPGQIPDGQVWYRSDERQFYRYRNGVKEKFTPERIAVTCVGGACDGLRLDINPASDFVDIPRSGGGVARYRLDRDRLRLV